MESVNAKADSVWKEIEALREKLNKLVEDNGNSLDSHEILTVSQELDQLIQIYIKNEK